MQDKPTMEKSIKTKRLFTKVAITAIAVVVTIIVIIYAAYLSHREFEETVVSQTQQQLLTIAKTTNKGIEEFFTVHLRSLKSISMNPLFQKKVSEKHRVDKPETAFCALRNLYEIHRDDVDALTLLDANGIMLHREPFIKNRPGMGHSDKPGVAYVIREHKPHVSEVFYNNLGNLAVSILEPIFYKDEFAGIVRWMIETDTISKRYIEPVKIGKKGFAWMFDNTNTVLSHPRKDLIGMSVLDVIKKMHKEKGKVFDESQTQEHIKEEHDYLNRVKYEEEGVGIFVNCTTDKDGIVAFKRVSAGKANFNLIATIPYDEIDRSINVHTRNTFGITGLVILLVGSGGLVLFKAEKRKTELKTEARYLKQIAKRAEALEELTTELNQIFNTAADGMRVIDKDFNVLRVNEMFLTLSGTIKEEALGKKCYEVFRGFLCHTPECPLARILGGEERVECDVEKECNDGVTVPCIVTATPFVGPDRKLIGIVENFKDISERKQAEEKLNRYAEELEQRNEEIKKFAYIVSHDLRGPLVNLKGFASELRSACEVVGSAMKAALPHLTDKQRLDVTTALQEEIPESLGFINSSVTRMDSLINAVLKLSRLGHREFKFNSIDMNAVVQASLQSIAHQIDKRQVKVTVGSLPKVVADQTSMEQIVDNLLNNAVIYLDPSRPGEIKITGESGSHETTFRVHDNGRGIAQEDTDKVFAPFRRAGKQDIPGEGMGLAYVQQLTHRHSGRIWCDSQPGVGTTFTFTISNNFIKGDNRV